MRINLNLATQKYENAREFYLRWGSALAAVLLLSVMLGIAAWSSYSSVKKSSQRITLLQQKIDTLEKERAAAEAILNRPENHDVREQSRFWNSQISQKSLSWTRLLTDLERLMPRRATVLSVQPKFEHGQFQLKLLIGGERHENALELLTNLEKSERFRFPKPRLVDETAAEPGKGPALVRFTIEATYTPAPVIPPGARSREGE